jgi:hypothetical protein
VTGQLPFVAERAFDVLLMHINETPPKPSDLVSGIPETISNVISKALAKPPDERYLQMRDMVANLETVWDLVQPPPHLAAPGADETMHHATVQIDSIQSVLKGPRFVVVATGSLLLVPNQDQVMIGRADPRSSVIPDIDLSMYGGGSAGVSRQHARMIREGDDWSIEDLSSTNGTYVNDQAVPPSEPAPLKDGDTVRCGQLVLTFHTDEASSL